MDCRDAYKCTYTYLNLLFFPVTYIICVFVGIRAVPMYLYTILKNVNGLENELNFFLVIDPQLLSEGHAWT